MNVKKLAKMSGVTERTLRYYDSIGLLVPRRSENGYREYGQREIDQLQQILFYRELGFELGDIRDILNDPQFDYERSLESHLSNLVEQRDRINLLINNVTRSIENTKGMSNMNNEEKFEGFKDEIVAKNTSLYGDEVIERYGKVELDRGNARMKGLSEGEFNAMHTLEKEIITALEKAVQNDTKPGSVEGRDIAKKHRDWLMYTWSDYSKEAHCGLAQMYVCDDRFKSYYDKNIEGCADFLSNAIEHYCSN